MIARGYGVWSGLERIYPVVGELLFMRQWASEKARAWRILNYEPISGWINL